jgi:hypothetical protein
MGGREGECEAMRGVLRDPGSGLLGDVRRVIVEDQLDRSVGRIAASTSLRNSMNSRLRAWQARSLVEGLAGSARLPQG